MKKRLTKGLTLIELTIAMATASILIGGLTVFSLFFSKQLDSEKKNDNTYNSALALKNVLSNLIDRYNYTFDLDKDFVTEDDKKVDVKQRIFVVEIEDPIYTYTYVRYYKFDDETSKLQYTEYKYDGENNQIPEESGITYDVYKCLSPMKLEITPSEDISNSTYETTMKKVSFTIDYDFVDGNNQTNTQGQKQLTFSKYVYFSN